MEWWHYVFIALASASFVIFTVWLDEHHRPWQRERTATIHPDGKELTIELEKETKGPFRVIDTPTACVIVDGEFNCLLSMNKWGRPDDEPRQQCEEIVRQWNHG